MKIETLMRNKGNDKDVVVTLGIEPFMLEGLENEIGERAIVDIKNGYDLKLSIKLSKEGRFYDRLLEATETTEGDKDYLTSRDCRKFEIEGLDSAPYIYDCIKFMKDMSFRYLESNYGDIGSGTTRTNLGRRETLTGVDFGRPVEAQQTLPSPRYIVDKGFKDSSMIIDPTETWIINKELTKASKLVQGVYELEEFGVPEIEGNVSLIFDIEGGVVTDLTLEDYEDPTRRFRIDVDGTNLEIYKRQVDLIVNDLKRKGIM